MNHYQSRCSYMDGKLSIGISQPPTMSLTLVQLLLFALLPVDPTSKSASSTSSLDIASAKGK